MTPKSRAVFAWMMAILALPCGAWAADPEPADAETAAALKILMKRVGTWDEKITIKPGKLVPPGATVTLVTVIKPAHGGRFLMGQGEGTREQEGQKQKTASTWLQTYNKQKRQYQSWFFYSVSGPGGVDYWGGAPAATLAEWDEKTQTMRMEGRDPDSGSTITGSFRYIDDDRLEWGVVTRDRDDNIIMEQTGMSTRRKEK